MAVVNIFAHGFICASLWIFRKANLNNTEELAFDTLNETLKRKNIDFNNIVVARQNEITELFEV